MKQGGKPVIVLITEGALSLAPLEMGSFDNTLINIKRFDAKVIAIDLGEMQSVANCFGYVTHSEHLKYAAFVTQGAYFTFEDFLRLSEKKQKRNGGSFYVNKEFSS